MNSGRLQVYQSEELRVTFDPHVCMHSGVCLRTLPAVFDVSQHLWVDLQRAPAEEIIAAVSRCPSRALRAQMVTSVMRAVKSDGTPG